MAETVPFNAPDKPQINWTYVGGGIVGVALLIFLLNKNKGSGGTVAAGTSINAALGSLEGSALDIQGAQSKAQTSIDTVQSGLVSGFSNVNTTITQGNAGITDLISHDVAGINTQLGSILGNEQTTAANLQQLRSDMENAFGANSAQVAAITSAIAAVGQQMQAGFTGLNSKADQLTQMLQSAAAGAAQKMDFAPFAGNIIFSRADNTRYLAGSTGLTELTYHQEMGLRGAGAQIMYIDPSLSKYKIGGVGDRG